MARRGRLPLLSRLQTWPLPHRPRCRGLSERSLSGAQRAFCPSVRLSACLRVSFALRGPSRPPWKKVPFPGPALPFLDARECTAPHSAPLPSPGGALPRAGGSGSS